MSDKNGRKVTVNTLDILATQHSETEKISIAVVNKEPDKEKKLKSAWMKIHMRGTKFKSIGSWEVR